MIPLDFHTCLGLLVHHCCSHSLVVIARSDAQVLQKKVEKATSGVGRGSFFGVEAWKTSNNWQIDPAIWWRSRWESGFQQWGIDVDRWIWVGLKNGSSSTPLTWLSTMGFHSANFPEAANYRSDPTYDSNADWSSNWRSFGPKLGSREPQLCLHCQVFLQVNWGGILFRHIYHASIMV